MEDRARQFEYGTDTPVYFAAGMIDPGMGRFQATTSTRQLTFKRQRRTDGARAVPPKPLMVLGFPLTTNGYEVRRGAAYGLALNRFALEKGADPKSPPPPVEFADGDELIVTCEADPQDAQVPVLEVRARIVRRPIIAPPPATYSLVVVKQDRSAVRVALHATSPLPQRIEFVDLARDLARGHIRRKAQFEWRFADIE